VIASAAAPARSKVFPSRTGHQLLLLTKSDMLPPRADLVLSRQHFGVATKRGRSHASIGHT